MIADVVGPPDERWSARRLDARSQGGYDVFKSSSIGMAALLGIGLLAGCGAPTVSTADGAPAMGQEDRPQADAMATVNEVDRAFVAATGRANQAEMVLSQLASERAVSADVRAFARRMVTDHTQAGQQLQQAAAQAGLTVPSDLTPEDQAFVQRLSGLSGEAFDQAYMAKAVQSHEASVTRLENEIRQGLHPAITGFARQILPTVQDHLRAARELAGEQAAPTS